MRKFSIAAGLFVCVALLVGSLATAEEKITSGPQVDQEVPGPFHPLNLTGAKAGEKNCLYCQNGNNPVAMIFARDLNDSVTKLIKKIDAATAEHADARMGSFVVFLSDSEDLPKKAKEMAEQEKINTTILSVDNPAGPQAYKIAKDSDVTVVLYREHKVKANYAFAKDGLKDKNIDEIVADISKICPKE